MPSKERFSSPRDIRLARVGDAYLLEQAVIAADDLDTYMAPLIAMGDALRSEAPSESTDVLRTWKPMSAAARISGESVLWWIRASIVQADIGGDFEWAVEAAPERDADYTEVAFGQHDAGGKGTATWRVSQMAIVLGSVDALGELSLTYHDHGTEGDERQVDFEVDTPLGTPRVWSVAAEVALGWSGDLQVTDDGATWPSAVQVVHLEGEGGGRAQGAYYKEPDVPLGFESCWDLDGDTTFMRGDEDISTLGGQSDCNLPSNVFGG